VLTCLLRFRGGKILIYWSQPPKTNFYTSQTECLVLAQLQSTVTRRSSPLPSFAHQCQIIIFIIDYMQYIIHTLCFHSTSKQKGIDELVWVYARPSVFIWCMAGCQQQKKKNGCEYQNTCSRFTSKRAHRRLLLIVFSISSHLLPLHTHDDWSGQASPSFITLNICYLWHDFNGT
jgi:hypothetical protein